MYTYTYAYRYIMLDLTCMGQRELRGLAESIHAAIKNKH